jgi:hypothetical protein
MKHGFAEVLCLDSLVQPGNLPKEFEGDGNQDISAATWARLAQADPTKAPEPRDRKPFHGTIGVEIGIVPVPDDFHPQTHPTAI